MIASSDLSAAIKTPGGQHKITLGSPTGTFIPPYITMHKLYGGEENVNPSRSFDMIFRIVALGDDQLKVEQISNQIEAALVGNWPIFPDGWEAWVAITQGAPFHNQRVIQDKPFYEMGSQYRIRAVKDKN